jgi:hypothetical protein
MFNFPKVGFNFLSIAVFSSLRQRGRPTETRQQLSENNLGQKVISRR